MNREARAPRAHSRGILHDGPEDATEPTRAQEPSVACWLTPGSGWAASAVASGGASAPGATPASAIADWRVTPPVLPGSRLTLRELCQNDAPALFAQLTSTDVARFISPPPSSVEGFERFITWARRRRTEGRDLCFAAVPAGSGVAVGMFQMHLPDPQGTTAEWGFAIGVGYWGTGLFRDGARLVLRFAFETLGIRRLEARSAVRNGRANGALNTLGAVRERTPSGGPETPDQVLWVIGRADYDWLNVPQPGDSPH